MPSFPPPAITFVLTSHIFRTFLARSRYFSTFSSPFFSQLSILWNCLDYNFTALVFLVNYHKIRSSGPNFMVCSNTEVPQKFEVVIFKHVFQDMVIPPFISLKPTLSCHIPMDCPTHCVIVSNMHLQYDWLSLYSACTFHTWDHPATSRFLLSPIFFFFNLKTGILKKVLLLCVHGDLLGVGKNVFSMISN